MKVENIILKNARLPGYRLLKLPYFEN